MARTRTSRTSSERGFTLLELLTVLTVIGALLFFAIPRYATNRSQSAQAVEAMITGAIRDARQAARHTGQIATLEIDDVRDRLPNGFELDLDGDQASAALVFFPLGNANGTSWQLQADGFRRTILVDPLTGRIRVEEG